MTKIYFTKLKPNAIIKTNNIENARYDIYPCFDESYLIVYPQQTIAIPTGIASAVENDYCFILKERSSTGVKGIAQRSGVVDSGYRGEWFVPITNTTNKPIIIVKKDYNLAEIQIKLGIPINNCIIQSYESAICQALLIPVPKTEIIEVTVDELNKFESKRGINCLGSTDRF